MGFSFRKINIEKFSDSSKDLKIGTNIDILEINKISVDFLNNNEDMLGIKFNYLINYEPNIAKIEFEGDVLISIEPNLSKEIIKQWKDKKISEEIKVPLFNIILRKSNIKALQFQDEMNIPLHIPFPSIKKSNDEKVK